MQLIQTPPCFAKSHQAWLPSCWARWLEREKRLLLLLVVFSSPPVNPRSGSASVSIHPLLRTGGFPLLLPPWKWWSDPITLDAKVASIICPQELWRHNLGMVPSGLCWCASSFNAIKQRAQYRRPSFHSGELVFEPYNFSLHVGTDTGINLQTEACSVLGKLACWGESEREGPSSSHASSLHLVSTHLRSSVSWPRRRSPLREGFTLWCSSAPGYNHSPNISLQVWVPSLKTLANTFSFVGWCVQSPWENVPGFSRYCFQERGAESLGYHVHSSPSPPPPPIRRLCRACFLPPNGFLPNKWCFFFTA